MVGTPYKWGACFALVVGEYVGKVKIFNSLIGRKNWLWTKKITIER